MSRSRAFNRTSRFIAKRRRRILRAELPGSKDVSRKVDQLVDHSQELIRKATEREALEELTEPQIII